MTSQRVRVVVAEDEFLVSLTIRAQLESMGYEVVGISQTGGEAILMTKELHPDVVIMDIGMPEMDGIEATRRIMAEAPTPVVVLTAYGDRDRIGAALAAGACGYVVKPAVAEQIRNAIEQVTVSPR
jgi:DNA-binding NarL/FixJ family response regulator